MMAAQAHHCRRFRISGAYSRFVGKYCLSLLGTLLISVSLCPAQSGDSSGGKRSNPTTLISQLHREIIEGPADRDRGIAVASLASIAQKMAEHPGKRQDAKELLAHDVMPNMDLTQKWRSQVHAVGVMSSSSARKPIKKSMIALAGKDAFNFCKPNHHAGRISGLPSTYRHSCSPTTANTPGPSPLCKKFRRALNTPITAICISVIGRT